MDTKEQDIQQHNFESIDMECNCCDDDDFGGKAIEFNHITAPQNNMRTLSADFNNGNLEISKNYNNNDLDYVDTGANLRSIDMECNCCDDDDDFSSFKNNNSIPTSNTSTNAVSTNTPRFYDYQADFSDDEYEPLSKNKSSIYEKEDDIEPELVINERKGDYIDQGTIENNYLDQLTKKHKNSNTKGSYNSYFHLAGNPKKEMQMFNHDMGSDISSGNITGTSSGEGSGEGCTSCGESLQNKPKQNLLENLLVLIGFDIIPKDNKFIVKDKYDLNPDIECNSQEEALNELQPYIDDMIITPLQANTGKDFKQPQEWVDWYNEQNQKEYPQCKSDIDYCKCLCKGVEDETK